jgi:hypothetical protein
MGYEVHLIDVVPLHVDEARLASERQPDHPVASLVVGDARALNYADESADAVPHWSDPDRRQRLLDLVRTLEAEPSLLGASSHLMAVARKA